MITIEAYRASIGSFRPKAQRHTQLSELEDLSGSYNGYKFTNHNAEQIYFLKAFVYFLIVVILYLNMNLAMFKLLKLLIDGDIESNPRPCPYKLQTSIQGTFHQAHPTFGETSGIQCARPLSVEELPETVLINGHVLKVEMLSNVNRLLGPSISFDKDVLPGKGLMFTTNGYCFSLIWAKQNVFRFDSHSINQEGSFDESGSSILLVFKTLSNVEKYIKTEYVKHILNFSDTQFDLQYIKITTECALSILSSVNKARNRIYKQKYDANEEIKKQKRDRYSSIIGTPDHDAIKKQKRYMYSAIIGTPDHDAIKKQKRDSSHDMCSAIIGTPEHDAIKKQKYERYSAIIGTPEHDTIQKQKRDLSHDMYSAIIGTPEHDAIKKQKRDSSHDMYSAIIGTPEHDAIKKQKCDKFSAIIGTPKHDAIKKQKRDLSHDMYSAIIGTQKHDSIKKQYCDRYSVITGTPEHDAIKKQKLYT